MAKTCSLKLLWCKHVVQLGFLAQVFILKDILMPSDGMPTESIFLKVYRRLPTDGMPSF